MADSQNHYSSRLFEFAVQWVKTQMRPFTVIELKKAYSAIENDSDEFRRSIGFVMQRLQVI